MSTLERRNFLKGSLGAAATLAVLSGGKASAAAEKIVVGIMGVGGRGKALLGSLLTRGRPSSPGPILLEPRTTSKTSRSLALSGMNPRSTLRSMGK